MEQSSSSRLRDGLLEVAELWAGATCRSVGALSSIVANHGQALQRLRDPSNNVTDATLEKFAAFLADPVNWPEGAVPKEAVEFAHRVGVSPAAANASPGKAGQNSPVRTATAAVGGA